MASGVFVDPSTDQRMISTGMDRRSGNGMVDLGMVADGTVCGDEKVSIFIQHWTFFFGCFCHIFEAHFMVTFQICMNATCVNIRPFRDYLRCPVNRDSVECSGRGVSLKKPKISLLLGPASDGVRFQSVLALEFTKLRTRRKTLCFEL